MNKVKKQIYQLFREEEESVELKFVDAGGIVQAVYVPIFSRAVIANPVDPGGDNKMTLALAMELIKKLPWRISYLNYVLFNTETGKTSYFDSEGTEIIKEIQ